ncbi:Fhn1p NDAI_0G00930 [Naumovozyma dairenensis CBS 421]|uniref:MARVEL domain-containing protein n=1 Tax=Naumovozyma dairenensis (strain ATCC 10597 / BCRC 20456 / CBS 421 / NBRC 0211 / NRRL Y-12639) TaxID=1071378 RepID=G0WDK8_NAUDC|nr:hypothetical protein NDAI_0G00930 [Naumovozyma dairenensis CBS 421]CCD25869.2 hypothetical protein NDAI_0G00930 [Naumovozyma dairenensis CBS 421]
MLSVADNLLRLLNAMFLVICIGLNSALLNTQQGHNSRINYCMFTCVYCLLTDSFFGILANFFEFLSFPFILFTLDFLNFSFTFVAGTVLATGIRSHSCNNQSYLDRNKITQGSGNRCRESQALVAFFYFSMFIFLIKLAMSTISMIQNGAFSNTFTSRRRRRNGAAEVGVPSISQV